MDKYLKITDDVRHIVTTLTGSDALNDPSGTNLAAPARPASARGAPVIRGACFIISINSEAVKFLFKKLVHENHLNTVEFFVLLVRG